MRVLLTGAAGNVGRGLFRALIAHGYEVLAVGRDAAKLNALCRATDGRAESQVCDLSSDPLTLPNDYDAVVHAAAHATAEESPDLHVQHNVVATRNLLRHAAQKPGRPFVFLSSISVYGSIAASCVDENTDIRNPGSYGASKLLNELMLREYGPVFASVALRLPGVLGPGARDPWLARVLRSARESRPISVYCPSTLFNNALHVDDLGAFVAALIPRARLGFDVLTVAAGDARPVRDVVSTMLDELDVRYQLAEAAAPRVPFTISTAKAAELYHFVPAPILDVVRRFAQTSPATQPNSEPALR